MKIHAEITPELSEFISRQHLFFVASAPLTLADWARILAVGLGSYLVVELEKWVRRHRRG